MLLTRCPGLVSLDRRIVQAIAVSKSRKTVRHCFLYTFQAIETGKSFEISGRKRSLFIVVDFSQKDLTKLPS
jgi:hypothetical protein